MALEIANCILQTCKLFCDLCYPELKELVKLKENKERLSCQIDVLKAQKKEIIEYIEDGKRKGKVATGQVEHALQRIQQVEQDYQQMLDSIETTGSVPQALCCNCNLLLELSQRVRVKGEEMKALSEIILRYVGGEGVVKDPPPPMVQEYPVPHVYGRQEVINRIMRFLDDDGIRIIGVYGITGVGKTTVAKMVNNQLLGKETFVFYVTVKEETDIKGIQNQIARRLGMNFGEDDSENDRASALFGWLKPIRFLLILEDVHRKLDLDVVGVPNRSDQSTKSKVLLTAPDREVCKTMSCDENAQVKLDPLPKAEAWSLFREKAGEVVEENDQIHKLAEEAARRCEGVPQFLVCLGGIMKDEEQVGMWTNAVRELWALRPTRNVSNSSMGDIGKEFRRLRCSYDRISGRSARLCFLYCCLFPRRCSLNVKRLVSYWRSEGLMEELDSKHSMYKGIQIIEMLRNLCLLKAAGSFRSVMMLGLIRDTALEIADEEGHKFFVRDEQTEPLKQWPTEEKIPQDIQRISLTGHQIQSLADQPQQEWSELSTLILQRNPLKSISDGFFHGMPTLKVLDLSHTEITTLPPSISTLVNTEALYLGGCRCLSKMPPIGKLKRLKLLDLSETQIEELPQGLEEVSQLKTLILSYTSRLTNIRRGLIPCLSAIEELDMHRSAYSWGLEGMVKPETAILEELCSLHKLEALYVDIQNPICLMPNEFADQWQMLWQFSFRIGEDINLPRRHDREVHVINSDRLLPSESVKAVLRHTQSLVLFNCTGIMWISQVGGSLKDLKLLFLHGCDDVSSLIIREDDVEPDGAWGVLEILDLRHLYNLESIWMGRAPRGGSLRYLTRITISDCPKLRCLFPIGVFGKKNRLKEIQVLGCASIEEVFHGEVMEERAGGDREIDEEVRLPCLTSVILEDLPSLTMVCKEEPFLPLLEVVRVKSCPLLKNLPIREVSEIHQIEGSKIWWEQLKWQNEGIKSALESVFLDIGV